MATITRCGTSADNMLQTRRARQGVYCAAWRVYPVLLHVALTYRRMHPERLVTRLTGLSTTFPSGFV